MKAIRNLLFVMMLVVASFGLVACGADKNPDEDPMATEEVTTRDDITREETTMEEITMRDETTEDEKKDKKSNKDDGVVGDIIDDAETKVDEIASDLED